MSDTTTDPWGPWHDQIGEGLAHCADYLGRLQRCLAGQIAPDRHYFGTKARALRDASVGLLRRARDVERWLGACDASYGTDGDPLSCALRAGHAGAHDEGPTPAERLAERADALAGVATEAADTLAWATLALADVRAVVCRACGRAGIADTGTHRLRHGAASAMLANGAPLHEIGQVLRHRDIATTAIYAKVDLAALASVAQPWPGSAR